jgi:hypothetical protein
LVSASDYWHWHHERNLWISGPLAAADGYRECLSKRAHVDNGHRRDADQHANAVASGLATAIGLDKPTP